MKTLFYTEEQVCKAFSVITYRVPEECKLDNLPRTADGLIVGGMVDENSKVNESAIVIGSTVTKASFIDEGAIVIGSTITSSHVGVEAAILGSELDSSNVYRCARIKDSWLHRSTVDRYAYVSESVMNRILVIGSKSRISRSFLLEGDFCRTRLTGILAVNTKTGSLYKENDNLLDFVSCVMLDATITGEDEETKHLIKALSALITPQTPVRAAEIDDYSYLTFFNKLDGSAVIDTQWTEKPLPLHATASAIEQFGTLNWGKDFVKQQYEKINEATQATGLNIPDQLIHIKGVDTAINLLEEMEANFK